ncbi:TetR/AcrR family transcriptional regulator [Geodermatophilus sp. SYSU D01106]
MIPSMPAADTTERRQKGRPLDEWLTARLLDVVLDMLADDGWRAVSVESVAREAKCGKTAVLRRWSSIATLVTEALSARRDRPPVADTGHLAGDLEALLNSWRQPLTRTERAVASLLGYCNTDEELQHIATGYVDGYLRAVVQRQVDSAADRDRPLPARRTAVLDGVLRALYLQRLSAPTPQTLPAVGPAVLSTVLASA